MWCGSHQRAPGQCHPITKFIEELQCMYTLLGSGKRRLSVAYSSGRLGAVDWLLDQDDAGLIVYC